MRKNLLGTHPLYFEPLLYQAVQALPFKAADFRLHYGNDPMQYGDLRIPSTQGPHPILIVIHGGGWISQYADASIMSPFSEAFTRKGLATWNIEYRPVDKGGEWPGLFLDVANAIDTLRILAPVYHLDLNRVVVIGQSAGGHLALWAAARHRLPKNSVLYSADPLPLMGAVNLAGPGNLKSYFLLQCEKPEMRSLVESIFPKLLGSISFTEDKLKQTSPHSLLPLQVKQVLLTGEQDLHVVPELALEYQLAAKEKGDDVVLKIIKNAAHFEVIAPNSRVWPEVEQATLALFESGLLTCQRI